ncbi:MAG: hypothetical protein NWF07_07000 [Candidatus Bathyarchaeota archaeon]|nr:hypothetical protein [Candidatus Bathyarchaeota archaeon]
MPRKGYKAITIPEKLAQRLREKADRENTSIPKQIEKLLDQGQK